MKSLFCSSEDAQYKAQAPPDLDGDRGLRSSNDETVNKKKSTKINSELTFLFYVKYDREDQHGRGVVGVTLPHSERESLVCM